MNDLRSGNHRENKKMLAELKKSRQDLAIQQKLNEKQKKDFEKKMREMGTIVDQYKRRIQHLET